MKLFEWVDWTIGKDGRINSSNEYLRLCDIVTEVVKESAHDLINGNTNKVSRLIVANLAHRCHISLSEQEDEKL